MPDEITLFRDAKVVVTNARFIAGPQTFALRGITSAKCEAIPPNYNVPLTAIAFAVVMAFSGCVSLYTGSTLLAIACFTLGVFLFALGSYLAWTLKPTFGVYLETTDGEVLAYDCDDQKRVVNILIAIDKSIAAGG